MPNKYAFPINPDVSLGEAIDFIAHKRGFGTATLFQKIFLEQFKEEFIEFWNGQGKNGLELWESYHSKFNLKESEQKALKELEEFEKRKKTYVALGFSEDKASELAKVPKEELDKALEVTKTMSYAKQSEVAETKIQKQEEKAKTQEQERIEQLKQLIAMEQEQLKRHGMPSAYYTVHNEQLKKHEEELAKLEQTT